MELEFFDKGNLFVKRAECQEWYRVAIECNTCVDYIFNCLYFFIATQIKCYINDYFHIVHCLTIKLTVFFTSPERLDQQFYGIVWNVTHVLIYFHSTQTKLHFYWNSSKIIIIESWDVTKSQVLALIFWYRHSLNDDTAPL